MEEEEEEAVSQEELRKQIAILYDRIMALASDSDELQKKKIKKLGRKLQEAMLFDDIADMQDVIDEATDFLIDVEMLEE